MDRFKDVNIHQISEEICNILLTNAMQIAYLILESRKRFEVGAIFPLSVQQGALAAGVLLTMSRMAGNRLGDSSLRSFQFLQEFFIDMSAINGPAERLVRTLRDRTATNRWGSPTQGPPQSTDPASSDRHETGASAGGPNDTLCLHRNDENGQCDLPGGCAADQPGATSASAYTKENGTLRNGTPKELALMRDLDHATVSPPSATNNYINFRSPNQLSHQCIDAVESESMPSSHTIDGSLTHTMPDDVSLEQGELFIPHLPFGTEDMTLPEAGPGSDSWNKDDVSMSWSETFKKLKEVNERPVSEKRVANEFGDVMGCVFKLW